MICGANNEITTYRMAVAAKEVFSSSPTLTSEPCYLEQLEPTVAAILDNQNAFLIYRAYIEGVVDVDIGDKIVDKGGNEYIAFGVQKFENNIDTPNQTEITMRKKYAKN